MKQEWKSVGRAIRILGGVGAFALVGAGIVLPALGHEFAVFYFLIAIFAGATGDFLAILITEGVAGLRSKREGLYR
jgi:hypothetical protein